MGPVLYAFRGHASGLDLAAVVAAHPELAGRPGAVQALRDALDGWAEARRARALDELDRALDRWRAEARAVRRTKVRRKASPALAAVPDQVVATVDFVPDASAIVRRAVPGGLVVRLAWPQPEAAISEQALVDLRRTLARRLDPALARHLARDAVLAEVLPLALKRARSEG